MLQPHIYTLAYYFSMFGADFAVAAVLISYGVVLGTASPFQLIVMTLLEIVFFTVNEVIGRNYLGVSSENMMHTCYINT